MRSSQYLIATLKETPADAEVISHQLMLRAGLIRKLASGLYTWMPVGLRVLHKVSQIIREEMDNAGAMEVSMPVVQPSDLWHESGRWEKMGPELLRFADRHQRDFCLGPTHEEVITDMVRNEFSSYKQLPATFYQIQTKFRDERRPRFGVMRAREFLMKDAYSFHSTEDSLRETYRQMHQAYSAIFRRLGLDFRAVLADSGNIGGKLSHEFHVLAESGEDEIVFSSESDYAANIEMAESGPIGITLREEELEQKQSEIVDTPGAHSIEEVSELLGQPGHQLLKTLIVEGKRGDEKRMPLVALVLRGDQELNATKAEKLPQVAAPLTFASDEQIQAMVGCSPGSIGPLNGLDMHVIADKSAAGMVNFTCGANRDGQHLINANWLSDCQFSSIEDIRKVRDGDPSPDGKGTLSIKRGVEVGHIFQLGTTYSEAMGASVLDENGKSVIMTMGCYGIGVSRIVAASIEQNHDENGIIWPDNIAPFQLAIVPLNAHKSETVQNTSSALWKHLRELGYEVLLDDRDKKTSPGVKFADMELMGIPHRLVVADRNLENGMLEYKSRSATDSELVPVDEVVAFLQERISR